MQKSGACPAGCRSCSEPLRRMARAAGGPRGRRLVGLSIVTFLLPLVVAIAGAAVGGPARVGQFVGALIGLAVGLIAAAVAARAMNRGGRERQ